jgi:hypothetical protein
LTGQDKYIYQDPEKIADVISFSLQTGKENAIAPTEDSFAVKFFRIKSKSIFHTKVEIKSIIRFLRSKSS